MTNLVCDVAHKNDMIPREIGRDKQPSNLLQTYTTTDGLQNFDNTKRLP